MRLSLPCVLGIEVGLDGDGAVREDLLLGIEIAVYILSCLRIDIRAINDSLGKGFFYWR